MARQWYEYEVVVQHTHEVLEGCLYPMAKVSGKELREFIRDIHELDESDVSKMKIEHRKV